MKKIILVINIIFIMFCFNSAFTEEKSNNKNTQLNFYTGMFDYSDHEQRAMLFGIQHKNEDLQRKTFLGNLSPITGGFFTENSAAYVYSGVEWNFDLGKIDFTPSFAPGLYGKGDGKDLGHILEFKTEVQASLDISKNSSFGLSYNHISNASLGDKNPGANNYTFNFLKKF